MKKVKYYFNTSSLNYERVVVSWKKKFFRVLGFLATSTAFGFLFIFLAYNFFDSPKEKRLKRQLAETSLHYDLLKQRADNVESVLRDIQERDNTIYRVIFEADPIPSTVREAGFGGADRYNDLMGYFNSGLVVDVTKRFDKLSKQLYIQSKSYDEVFELAKNKSTMLASIPAIQPIANKELKYVASGYGWRIHPIYKTQKMHTGMDFTAPVGTPVHATGNGVISRVENMGRGYGNNVEINHGYGYATLYAHLSKMAVRPGQKIKRGELIGYVGSSGSSTGPHLHYEVKKNGNQVNPIHYYYNDLTPEEYDKMLEISSRPNQSFD